ncbi:MAG: O-antigen ligase family protein [Caldilineaceae bacterium]
MSTKLRSNRLQFPIIWYSAGFCLLVGLGWLLLATGRPQPLRTATATVASLQSGAVATMLSPAFVYDDAWQVNEIGADPTEPNDPWHEPAGVMHFTYSGRTLALYLAPGDYWAYLYIMVDGQPANLLPTIAGNLNYRGEVSGYRTLYAPEAQSAQGPTPQWVPVHRAATADRPHEVYLELWRGWGQIPLRGVAVDALPRQPWPAWPGVAALLVAAWGIGTMAYRAPWSSFNPARLRPLRWVAPLFMPVENTFWGDSVALVALILIGAGHVQQQWLLVLMGLLLLAWSSVARPARWLAALLLALPTYYSAPLQLLPGRALSLVDLGVLGGLVVMGVHWLLDMRRTAPPTSLVGKNVPYAALLFAAMISWALLAAVQADYLEVALREWRTVFLNAGLFALLLTVTLRTSAKPAADQQLLLYAWLVGGTLVALVGIWQYASGVMLITAEGVHRVRALYGSPNNLALYLERTLAPTLALALFGLQGRRRWFWLGLALLQGGALLLTFSKGALFLGLPILLAVLWIGGYRLLQHRGSSRRLLWAIVVIGLCVLLALSPFLGTERFQRLWDLQQGTGFLRLQLWRSAWQMALDHPLFGVGPDNFLYAYRSYYLLPAAWEEPNLNHPHNWLLDWWTRLGLPGLLLALGWFGLLIRRHWQSYGTDNCAVLHLGFLAATVAALAHGLIDASYALPDLMLVWALLTFMPLDSLASAKAAPPLPPV